MNQERIKDVFYLHRKTPILTNMKHSHLEKAFRYFMPVIYLPCLTVHQTNGAAAQFSVPSGVFFAWGLDFL